MLRSAGQVVERQRDGRRGWEAGSLATVAAVAARGGGGDGGWASGVDGVEFVLEARGAGVRGEHD